MKKILSEDSHWMYSLPLLCTHPSQIRLSALAEVISYCSTAILNIPEEGVTKSPHNQIIIWVTAVIAKKP